MKKKSTLLRVIAAAAAVIAVLSALSFPLRTVEYTITSDKITEPVRIAQISDLHSCRYGKNMETLIDAIDAQSPDIVVLTGDIYDDVVDNSNTSVFLENIGKRYPCFYAAGNHELRTSRWADYAAEAESFGITVLEGENVRVGEIMICGAAMKADRSFDWEDSVCKCAENADPNLFNVLLYHFPEQADYCRSFGKFDLILSGHAHGGQWRIPGLVNGLFTPEEGFFPAHAGGRYDFDDCTMIVSRGLSRTKEKIPRIFNNPELVIVDIVPEETE